jgi:hypothetical protein
MSLVILGIVGAVLLLLYLSWRFASAGSMLRAIFAWVSRPFAILSWASLQIAQFCKTRMEKGVAWPEKIDPDEEVNIMGRLVSRLVYLVVSLVLVLGEFPLSKLRSAAFFGLLVSRLNLPLDVFTALLWILMPGLWLFLTLEAAGLLPQWAGLLPSMHRRKAVRWIIGIASLLLLLVSLFVSFLFFTWGQCVVTGSSCANDASLQVNGAGEFGILLVLAGTVSLWGIVLGTLALVACVYGLLYCVFGLLHLIFGLVGDSVHGLSRVHHTSFGDPFPYPPVALTQLPPRPLLVAATGQAEQPGTITITAEEELLFMDPKRNTAIIGVGGFASRMVAQCIAMAQQMGATSTMLAAGAIDLDRPYQQDALMAIAGMKNISPTHRQISEAQADEAMASAYTKLLHIVFNRLVEAFATKHGGNIIVLCDMGLTGHVREPLNRLHLRLPKQKIVVVSELLPPDRRGERLAVAYQDILDLAEEKPEGKAIATTFVIDPRSQLSLRAGEETQEQAVVMAFLSLAVGPLHDERNVSFAEVCERLGACSPICGVSCAIAPVASGKKPFAAQILKAVAPKAGNKGYGDVVDLVAQSRSCIQSVLQEQASTATPEAVDLTRPVIFLVLDVPLSPADKRWKDYIATITSHIKRTYPQTTGIVVQANPPTLPGIEKQTYRCMATAFYPLTTQAFMFEDKQRLGSESEEAEEEPDLMALEAEPIKVTPARMRRRANGARQGVKK